jgi:hypothetical protein
MLESGGFGVNALLPEAAEAALEEFVLTLLLRGHPHNFSEELERRERHPDVRSASLNLPGRCMSAFSYAHIRICPLS